MSDKLLIIGENGQLARALKTLCVRQNRPCETLGSAKLDLISNSKAIADIIANTDATAVINASAYTAVDTAETDRDAAFALNATAPEAMASACKTRGMPFIHISTDYVFNGQASTPYPVNTPIDPINTYGESKAAGEAAILAIGSAATILRTSWVYDGMGKNFLTTMLRLGAERATLNVVADQIGRPTYAGHLAEACLKIIDSPMQTEPRIFHVSNGGTPISWKDFATAIFNAADIDCHVNAIPTSDYPTPAKRPAYSVLDISAFEQTFNHPLPLWQDGLTAALNERL